MRNFTANHLMLQGEHNFEDMDSRLNTHPQHRLKRG